LIANSYPSTSNFKLSLDQPVICHADTIWNDGKTTTPENLTTTNSFILPNKAVICHADEELHETFSEDIKSTLIPSKPQNLFVYVALGDSYQSGEGAGNSILDSQEYLATAYEKGTYTDTLVSGDNGCHRALLNYAKLNRDKFQPGAEVVLIDKTCSGAKIENGAQPPIVGDMGSSEINPNSQIAQALADLTAQGLSPADVDLVTVGMGGNDARFSDIVQSCLAPSLIKEALNRYPGAPNGIEKILYYT